MTQIILMERIETLGNLGDVVEVKPGYARNYLLPQKKALRATKANLAYFDAQKKALQTDNEKKRKEAEKLAKKLDGIKVPLIRQASESGQLFGSVTARDIAQTVTETSGETVNRTMVSINQNFKMIGLFPVSVVLHPEVKVDVVVNIARTVEEAEKQAKTGKALIAESANTAPAKDSDTSLQDERALESVLDDSAVEARRAQAEEEKGAADE